MKVVLVLATSSGGVGRHVAELADGLTDTGFDVLVAGPQRVAAEGAFEQVDISDRPRPVADLRAVVRLRRIIRGAAVVHAHGLRAGALTGIAARTLDRRNRPALVVTLHNALVSGGRIAVVHRLLERIVARTARVVLVVSDDVGVALRARGARDVRRAIVPAPLLPPPAKDPAEVRASLEIPDETALLVTIARLAPQKGLDGLITATALLEQKAMAVIAGDGPLHDQLQLQIEQANAPVRLIGHRSDVPDLIAAADVVVLPSRWEGQPLVAQEALRAGAALVATDAGGTAAVTGDGARLVPPGDPVALARAIDGLLADPAARAQLRARARARELPTAKQALEQVAGVYRELG